jgi:hypothetical protein
MSNVAILSPTYIAKFIPASASKIIEPTSWKIILSNFKENRDKGKKKSFLKILVDKKYF